MLSGMITINGRKVGNVDSEVLADGLSIDTGAKRAAHGDPELYKYALEQADIGKLLPAGPSSTTKETDQRLEDHPPSKNFEDARDIHRSPENVRKYIADNFGISAADAFNRVSTVTGPVKVKERAADIEALKHLPSGYLNEAFRLRQLSTIDYMNKRK